MKTVIKIGIGFIVVVLVALFTLPMLFQDKIKDLIKEEINKNLNAKVDFSDADLSLIRNFPNASVKLTDISVLNYKPFEGDTLFYSKAVNLKMSLLDVINSKLNIKAFEVNNSKVNVFVHKDGKANYDITKVSKKESPKAVETENSKAVNIGVESYQINNLHIIYKDEKSKMYVHIDDLNHSGSGDLSAERTKLDTQTSLQLSFKKDKSTLIDKFHLDLKALLDLDLKNQKFAFLDNTAHINQLPLIFEGYVKLNNTNKDVSLKFHTPSSDFKNFLALVPKQYAKNTKTVKTTGNFEIKGDVNGLINDKHIPKININIASNNASFKFPELPKGVNNIHINTSIINETGYLKDTYVAIDDVSFKIDNNALNVSSLIKNLTINPLVSAKFVGKLDLEDINKVYPLEKGVQMKGLIDADLSTKFDLQAVQKSIPERIVNNGRISLNDFKFASKGIVNPLFVSSAEVNFQPTKILLTNFDAKSGSSDFQAKGEIDDLLGFLMLNKEFKGNFALTSNTFKISDFMQDNNKDKKPNTETKTTKPQESLKIPKFLNIVTDVKAKHIYYDNLELKNASGKLILRDQKAIFENLKAEMFEGQIAFNGVVNTKDKTPNFDMKMGIKQFNIASSFKSMETLQKLAPIVDVISGKFNTTIDLKGNLTKDFTPDMNSLAGNALAELKSQGLDPKNSKLMSTLDKNISFIDLKKLNLDDIKTQLTFKNGKVNVKPFTLKYKDIAVDVQGSHGFDQSMDYKLKLDVPAKYLGSEVNGLLSKLDKSSQNIKVPIFADLTGSFKSPKVQLDTKTAVNDLTQKLVAQQKSKLKNKAGKEAGKLINSLLGGKSDKKDDKKKDNKTQDAVKKGLKLLGF